MKLRLSELIFRAWYYMRLGYHTYLSFIVGFITFVSTSYYLAVRSVPLLEEVFPHFYVFIIFAILVIVPVAVSAGWLHMKRTLAYPTDVAIGVEANPYNYRIVPGKETEIMWPMHKLYLRALQMILEKEKMLSPEEKREFENIQGKIERLRKGGVIGAPRQRRILAALEERK